MEEIIILTSPSGFTLAASMTTLIESHAHLALSLDHGSISPFFRGAYVVGHRDDLRCNALIVRAAVRGTAKVYGSDRLRSEGKGGGVGESFKRSDIASPCFRIRFKCPSSGDSTLFIFNHLVSYKSQSTCRSDLIKLQTSALL